LAVEALPTPTSFATPTAAPLRQVVVDLVLYYDRNGNQAPEADEGIAGASVRALDVTTNKPLARGLTDDAGYVRLLVAASGAVRVSIPLLGYSQQVDRDVHTILVKVKPLPLPVIIP
jgi:hypothetical protein